MGKVHWERPNAFTHCIECLKSDCLTRDNKRPTAGCASGEKPKSAQARNTRGLMRNEVSS
jgi:hypothetical protein